ncbi:MAG: hypothetical protein AAGG11_09335 [Pseudomonadota bacterium]
MAAVAIATALSATAATALADTERGNTLAAVCAGCHAPGTAAASVTETFPNIWGLNELALRQRLLDYQQDLGAPTLMNRIAKGYTEEELTLIAAAIAAVAPEEQP